MSARRASWRRAAAVAAALVLLAGCGDPALWARWQAERGLFRLRALEHRMQARHAGEAAFVRLEARYRALLEAWPPERWAPPGTPPGPARDVGAAAGQAGLAAALSQARRGRDAEAERALAALEPRLAGLPGVLLHVRLAHAAELERLGRFDEGEAERFAVAGMDPLAADGGVEPEVLEAPVALAARLRARGDAAGANALLERAGRSFAAALARGGPAAKDPLAEALSAVQAARGDAAGALATLRARIPATPPEWVPDRMRSIASRALDAGAPESALAYAAQAAARDDSRPVAGLAWLVAAQAFERLGEPDSALARYDLILTHWGDPGMLGPSARYRRAELLERTGQWERARAEYLALAAAYPTNVLAFLSARRIVQHHLQQGEPELARLAGETAIDNLRRLLASNRDPAVQLHAAAVEGDVLLALGRFEEAEHVMLDLWKRFPDDSTAESAALAAARLAEHRPGGAPRADSVRAALARGAADATVRAAARRESGAPGAR